jgi:hypothetical protein
MLLGHKGKYKSQSDLMRSVTEDVRRRPWEGKAPASARVGWHASPEELAIVLQEEADPSWEAQEAADAASLIVNIDDSIRRGHGAIALIWSSNLGTKLPHWVVVSGRTRSHTEDPDGFWILDPTAANRPDTDLRYESFLHDRKLPINQVCACQAWKDSSGREHFGQRIWVSRGRFEELLDEGAVKGNGLRYAIVNGGKGRQGPNDNKPRDSAEKILTNARVAEQATVAAIATRDVAVESLPIDTEGTSTGSRTPRKKK